MADTMRTPLHRVLGLGSAKSGTEAYWRQRLTALANIPLTIGFIIIAIKVADEGYRRVVDVLSSPLVAIVLALMVVSVTVHMRLGMQVVIEDYVHGAVRRQLAMVTNTFFSIAVGAVSLFAILKLAFGG
ncbi:succinate dehydrogenase, hydrophobic membrane anchor protein [Bauldia sp.]|uniref:succinate dehydrogenase, hydrophobic membrane anchor protein n=1 Tax=Bauldia sp. TaxID=2575872 RepID=UPI003BAD4118